MHKKIALSTLAFALMAPASIALAQDNQPANGNMMRANLRDQKQENREQRTDIKQGIQANRANLAQKRLEFQDKKEKMTEDKCKNIETKISTRVGRYENNIQMLEKVYSHMQARLTRLVERLDKAGADTAKLKTDIVTLNTKIEKLKTDHATFMATLKDSQTFVCGKSEGEFKGKLEQARKVPELINADRADIKNFYNTTIKADLQAIRKTLAEQKETAKIEKEAEKPATPSNIPVL